MKSRLLTLSITAGILLTTFLTPPQVFAAPYGLSINPPLLRVQVKPGKSITQVFTITNLNSEDKFLVARIIPFNEADKRGNPSINLKAKAGWEQFFTLANANIKLNEPFTINGGSSQQLILNITIPESASLQDIYATFLVTTYSNSTTNSSFQGSQISATIGSNLLITITSDVNPPTILKVQNLIPTSGTFFKLGNTYLVDNISPVTFSAEIKNDGNFTAETKGVFRITTNKNNPVYLEGILPVYVISKNTRTLINTQGKNFSFTPVLSQIGPHRASIEIITDNSNTTTSVDFIFLPIKALLGLLFSIILLNTILRLTQKPKTSELT